ncbi:MAG: hypothetical protein KDD43_00865 [Bdellovibrionales bacterium]|nr:hypothetical protein [Bdellovibrionales bacterium]
MFVNKFAEIEEAAGQKAFVESNVLPTQMSREAKAKLEEMGVEFLGKTKGTRIFQDVKLPDGWSRIATEHTMWSELLNEKGEVVAEVFYKASSHDKRAELQMRMGV